MEQRVADLEDQIHLAEENLRAVTQDLEKFHLKRGKAEELNRYLEDVNSEIHRRFPIDDLPSFLKDSLAQLRGTLDQFIDGSVGDLQIYDEAKLDVEAKLYDDELTRLREELQEARQQEEENRRYVAEMEDIMREFEEGEARRGPVNRHGQPIVIRPVLRQLPNARGRQPLPARPLPPAREDQIHREDQIPNQGFLAEGRDRFGQPLRPLPFAVRRPPPNDDQR